MYDRLRLLRGQLPDHPQRRTHAWCFRDPAQCYQLLLLPHFQNRCGVSVAPQRSHCTGTYSGRACLYHLLAAVPPNAVCGHVKTPQMDLQQLRVRKIAQTCAHLDRVARLLSLLSQSAAVRLRGHQVSARTTLSAGRVSPATLFPRCILVPQHELFASELAESKRDIFRHAVRRGVSRLTNYTVIKKRYLGLFIQTPCPPLFSPCPIYTILNPRPFPCD
ncbi:ORFS365W [Human betaherpesvirus 5]|nr:ORFS365W [Human betaherpesvirus 5]QHX40737.1 ORFS365W [Human betaherpesvirus 5]